MSLLIDGYNLLNVSGIIGGGIGPGTLERSRRALLNALAASIEPSERERTTIVFDAKDSPPGLPRTTSHESMTVRFAAEYAEADDLIEELIRTDSAPRQLTVVSSDHRLQAAARRRRATAIDSDKWFAELRRADKSVAKDQIPPEKIASEISTDEARMWLEAFGPIDVADLRDEAGPIPELHPEAAADDSEPTATNPPSAKHPAADIEDIANPFPPGYAEDLLDDQVE